VPFEYQPYRSDLTGTIADLMTRGDRARAEALRAGGAAQARAAEVSGRNAQELAGTIGNIAQGVGHQVTQYYEDKPRMEMQQLQLDAAKRDAHEEAALRAIFAKPEPPKPEEIYQAVGPKKGAEILKGFAALRQENQKSYTSTQQLVGSITGGILALPEGLRAEAYTHARENLVSRGLVDPAQVPEQYDPAFLQSRARRGDDARQARGRAQPAAGGGRVRGPGEPAHGRDGRPAGREGGAGGEAARGRELRRLRGAEVRPEPDTGADHRRGGRRINRRTIARFSRGSRSTHPARLGPRSTRTGSSMPRRSTA
jgi:hypothetical protein